jgi:pimeloyl-ACP methyl ester carboxylesterase
MNQAVTINSLGNPLRGTLSIPHRKANPQPLVVMATGDGVTGSQSSTWADFRAALDESGLASVIFDFQGLGESAGPTEKLTLSVGLHNMRDCIEWVRQQEWVDRIAILGSSFGGNVALLYAAHDPHIAALALKSPVSFYPETHELSFGEKGMAEWKESGYNQEYGYEYGFYLDAFDHNTYAEAKKINCPVFIVHGDADRDVPIRQSLRLMECLGNAELVSLPGVKHDYAQGDARKVMTAEIVQWLSNTLRSAD